MTTTETSMRERIARAIATASSHELVEERWPTYLPDADAVLDAMREPTEEMTHAGCETMTRQSRNTYFPSRLNISSVYVAMLDAAKEGK